MSPDSARDEVTIFQDTVAADRPETAAAGAAQNDQVLPEMYQSGAPEQAPAATLPEAVWATPLREPQRRMAVESARPPQPEGITLDSLVLHPAVSLLVLRLLGIGLVIILFLLLIGFFFNLLSVLFGGPENRYFPLLLGVVTYMVIGFVAYKQWAGITYTIYPDYLLIERGWLRKSKVKLEMNQFGGALVDQDIIGKIFQYGSIRLLFAGAVGKLAGETLADIANPFENYQLLMTLISQTRATA